MTSMNIAKALKNLRKDLNLTQAQMVKGTQISITHYSKLEKSQNRIFVDDLINILDKRNISVSYFFDYYFQNDFQTTISEKLNLAFYNQDIRSVEKIKKKISSKEGISQELKDRVLLISMTLEQEKNVIEVKKSKLKVINDFFKYDDWKQNDTPLIILGNLIRKENLYFLEPIIFKLVREYKHLNNFSIDKQRRLATIGINYLFNLRMINKDFNKKVVDILEWVNTVSNIPEFGIFKEIVLYFSAVYNHDEVTANKIKEILELIGYKSISEKLPE